MRRLLLALALLAGCAGKQDPIPIGAPADAGADSGLANDAGSADAFFPDAGADAPSGMDGADGGDAGPSDAPAEGG